MHSISPALHLEPAAKNTKQDTTIIETMVSDFKPHTRYPDVPTKNRQRALVAELRCARSTRRGAHLSTDQELGRISTDGTCTIVEHLPCPPDIKRFTNNAGYTWIFDRTRFKRCRRGNSRRQGCAWPNCIIVLAKNELICVLETQSQKRETAHPANIHS